jgi:hypothetical protein
VKSGSARLIEEAQREPVLSHVKAKCVVRMCTDRNRRRSLTAVV